MYKYSSSSVTVQGFHAADSRKVVGFEMQPVSVRIILVNLRNSNNFIYNTPLRRMNFRRNSRPFSVGLKRRQIFSFCSLQIAPMLIQLIFFTMHPNFRLQSCEVKYDTRLLDTNLMICLFLVRRLAAKSHMCRNWRYIMFYISGSFATFCSACSFEFRH